MKLTCSLCVLFCCFVGVLSQSGAVDKKKDREMRRALTSCIIENKVTYKIAVDYSKGNFQDESYKGKCFLKCFAVKLMLVDGESFDMKKEELVDYAKYYFPEQTEYERIINDCDRTTERSEDNCVFVFQMYKCLWTELLKSPEPENVRNSFYDVLGFNQCFDEGEIQAEIDAGLLEKSKADALIEALRKENKDEETANNEAKKKVVDTEEQVVEENPRLEEVPLIIKTQNSATDAIIHETVQDDSRMHITMKPEVLPSAH